MNKKHFLAMIAFLTISTSLVAFITRAHWLDRINEAQSEVVNYFNNKKDTSVGARFDLWRSALIGIEEKPILGWGSKGYLELKRQHVREKKIDWYTLRFNNPHNQFLDIWVKRGSIALISLFFVLFIPLIYFIQHFLSSTILVKMLSLLGVSHITSIIVYNVTQSFLSHNSGSIFYFFMIVVLYKTIQSCQWRRN